MTTPGTSSSVIVDGSALVALLVDAGPAGDWVAEVVQGAELAAPHLVLFETADGLRRQLVAGTLSASDAALAHADLLALPLELWPYEALAERVWELRAFLAAFEAEHGAITDAEMDEAIRSARSRATVVRSTPARTSHRSRRRLLTGVDAKPLDEALGRRAGAPLGRCSTGDAGDAALVRLADDGDTMLTCDPADLRALAEAAGVHVDLVPA